MALDFYLEANETETECICACCDNVHIRKYIPQLYWANITHNLGIMADVAGIYDCLWRPDEHGIQSAQQIIEILEKGLKDMKENPDKFTPFTPSNGWGTLDGLIKFTEKVLHACNEYPKAKIRISR